MEFLKVSLFYICATVIFGENFCEGCNNDLIGKSAAVRLSNDLFCSYNKNVRPVVNQSTQINVNTTLYVFNVHMDDQWNILQISIQLMMTWKDEFLVWDPLKYDNIEDIFEQSTEIWKPDIMSYNVGFNGDTSAFSYFLPESMVKINKKGIVKYNHRISLTSQCTANLIKWPFDSHKCTFYLGSPIYTNAYVNFTFPGGFYQMYYFQPDREWKINNFEAECIKFFPSKSNQSHCILKYDINVTRFSSMYKSSVIIPAVVISLMRTFTFLMGRGSSHRIILLCLFFISEIFYIQFLDMKIPNNGENIVYIVVLLRNSLILTAIAIVITIISNELYNRGMESNPRNGPEWLKSILKFLLNKRPITILTNFNTQGTERLIERSVEEDTFRNSDENALFWKTSSILIDRLSFIITLAISLINFLFLIP